MCDMDEAEQAEYFLWVEAAIARAKVAPTLLRPKESLPIRTTVRPELAPSEA
jgi:hypothetical protein